LTNTNFPCIEQLATFFLLLLLFFKNAEITVLLDCINHTFAFMWPAWQLLDSAQVDPSAAEGKSVSFYEEVSFTVQY
jgi:hypothetical protein